MKEGWMKNDKGWMKDDEGWMKNEEGWWFQAVEGFWWRTNKRTDICDCRVAFATGNDSIQKWYDGTCFINYVLSNFTDYIYIPFYQVKMNYIQII